MTINELTKEEVNKAILSLEKKISKAQQNKVVEQTKIITTNTPSGSLSSDDNKMDKQNPKGKGSFSLNRKENTTVGSYSTAEGYRTEAKAQASHAEGFETTASGKSSHAEGNNTIANSDAMHAAGKFNKTTSGVARVTGWGSSYEKKDIEVLDTEGNLKVSGKFYSDGKEVAIKEAVESALELKADKEEVEAALDLKADDDNVVHKDEVDEELSTESNNPIANKIIAELIPEEASGENKLTDKDYVDTEIENNTPRFLGIIDSINKLPFDNITNNDFIVIRSNKGLNPSAYDLYMYKDGWHLAGTFDQFQIDTNGQAALESGITNTLVNKFNNYSKYFPSAASEFNQLADKDFVNSSIATNTAFFKGTYETLDQIKAISNVTNNDYAFLVSQDSAGNTVYKRYKFSDSTKQWIFEYDLNNSSFTAEQWAAIQSGITDSLVTKLSNIETGAQKNVQSNWNQTTTTADDYIKNKPSLGTAAAKNVPTSGNASSTQVVMGNDTRLTNARTPTSHTHTKSEITDFPAIPAAVTESTVSGWGFTKNSGTYSKPSTGIPKTDLASAVQTSLGKADTALQSHQDISGKENTSNKVSSWSSTTTDAHYPSEKLVKTALNGKVDKYETTMVGLGFTANSDVDVAVFLNKIRASYGNRCIVNFSWSDANGAYITDGTNKTAKISGYTLYVGLNSLNTSSGTWQPSGALLVACNGTNTIYHLSATINETAGTIKSKTVKAISFSDHTHSDYNGKITITDDFSSTLNDDNYITYLASGENPTTGKSRKLSQLWTYIRNKIRDNNLLLKNPIQFVGTKATHTMIKFLDNTANTNGDGIVIGGGGATVIGGGESANTWSSDTSKVASADVEIMDVVNDGNVRIVTNIQSGVANAKTSTFDKDGNLTIPGDMYVGDDKKVLKAASQTLTDTEKSQVRTNIGAGTSSLTIGTTATTAAAGNHTHSTYNNKLTYNDYTVLNTDGTEKYPVTDDAYIIGLNKQTNPTEFYHRTWKQAWNYIKSKIGLGYDSYDATKTYALGDIVTYNGTLYYCSTAITTKEAWTSGHWTSLGSLYNRMNTTGVHWIEGAYNATTYPTYDATKTYAVGDLVVYNNIVYKCTTAITKAEAWTSGHWSTSGVIVAFTGTDRTIKSYTKGLTVAFKMPLTGSAGITLNINGLGAKTIRRNTGSLTTHLPKDTVVVLVYDGTYFCWADYDANTNTYVTQSVSTTANYRPIMLGYQNTATANADITSQTNQVYAAKGIEVKPSTGELRATSFTENGTALSSKYAAKSSLATVATSGSYSDLSNKPTIPTVTDTYSSTSTNAMSGKAVASAISNKVDKVDGKGLSTNDFTNTDKAAITYYGTCSTSRATNAKVVACSNFELTTGAKIVVKFTDTAGAAPTSGNITMNVNSKGAKNVYNKNGTQMTYSNSGEFRNNRYCEFVYDGTNFVWLNYDSNTTYSTITQAEITAGTSTSTRVVTPKLLADNFAKKSSDSIIAMTGYSKPTNVQTISEISATDSLNTAIGKLEVVSQIIRNRMTYNTETNTLIITI